MKPSFAATLFLSSLVSAQYKDIYRPLDRGTWRYQFWNLDTNICLTKSGWLHAVDSSLVYLPALSFSGCKAGAENPAKFVWNNSRLYLVNDNDYLQRVFVSRSTNQVLISDTTQPYLDPRPGRWDGQKEGYLRYDGELLIRCKEGCQYVFYSGKQYKHKPLPPNCKVALNRGINSRDASDLNSPPSSLSSSQDRLKPNQSSLASSFGLDISPATVSSLSAPDEVNLDKGYKDASKFQFYMTGENVCVMGDFLYAFNSSFYYRPKSVYADCEVLANFPATFIWDDDHLYLFHKTNKQRVYVDPTTYRVTFEEAGPFKNYPNGKGQWTGRYPGSKLRYDGKGFIACKEDCSYVLYSKKAVRNNRLPAHCHEIENEAVVKRDAFSCFYF